MTITDKCWRYNMKVAIITANTDIYKGTKANESGEAVKLVRFLPMPTAPRQRVATL